MSAVAVAATAWGAAPWPAGAWWWLMALAAALFALAALAGWLWGASCASRARLAARADRNGRALLELADEIEMHLWQQRAGGAAVWVQAHWPRLCRQAALDHLECINRLMIEDSMRR